MSIEWFDKGRESATRCTDNCDDDSRIEFNFEVAWDWMCHSTNSVIGIPPDEDTAFSAFHRGWLMGRQPATDATGEQE